MENEKILEVVVESVLVCAGDGMGFGIWDLEIGIRFSRRMHVLYTTRAQCPVLSTTILNLSDHQ